MLSLLLCGILPFFAFGSFPTDDAFHPMAIAHSLHAVDLYILREIAGGDFVVLNKVPHISKNLTQGVRVVNSTNVIEIEDIFHDMLLNLISNVIDHIGERQYEITNFGTVELIGHQMHMYDIYRNVQSEYQRVSPSVITCLYVENVLLPKVIEVQWELAKRIQNPEKYYAGNKKYHQYADYVFTFEYGGDGPNSLDKQERFPPLIEKEDWAFWKEKMVMPAPDLKDVAIFLKCLNV